MWGTVKLYLDYLAKAYNQWQLKQDEEPGSENCLQNMLKTVYKKVKMNFLIGSVPIAWFYKGLCP